MTREDQKIQMGKFFETAETHEELKQLSMLFIFDMEYKRSDIAQVLHDVEIEKGWY